VRLNHNLHTKFEILIEMGVSASWGLFYAHNIRRAGYDLLTGQGLEIGAFHLAFDSS
jgi:hypothetical protein